MGQSTPGQPASVAETVSPPYESTGSNTFLSIVETPFLIAFKAPICILTVAIAAPMSAAAALADSHQGWATRRDLTNGVQQNCGLP
jgi:hypothetical protein